MLLHIPAFFPENFLFSLLFVYVKYSPFLLLFFLLARSSSRHIKMDSIGCYGTDSHNSGNAIVGLGGDSHILPPNGGQEENINIRHRNVSEKKKEAFVIE